LIRFAPNLKRFPAISKLHDSGEKQRISRQKQDDSRPPLTHIVRHDVNEIGARSQSGVNWLRRNTLGNECCKGRDDQRRYSVCPMTRQWPAAGTDRSLVGRRHGKELKHHASSHSHRACPALDPLSLTTGLSVPKKQGGTGATCVAAPWRQGTETDSGFIVLPPTGTVNSQRRAPTEGWSGREREGQMPHGKEPKTTLPAARICPAPRKQTPGTLETNGRVVPSRATWRRSVLRWLSGIPGLQIAVVRRD